MCEICSKLKLKTRKRRQWRHFGVFIDKFKQILHIVHLLNICLILVYLPELQISLLRN